MPLPPLPPSPFLLCRLTPAFFALIGLWVPTEATRRHAPHPTFLRRMTPPRTLMPTHTPPLGMLVLRSAPHARGAGTLVPQKPPDFGCVSRRATSPMVLLPTHTPPPPLWILVLRLAPRASGAGILVPQRPPAFGYISRRVRHDHHLPGTSEDVNIVPVDCFTRVRTGCSATLTDAYATIAMIRNLSEDVNIEPMMLPRLGKDGVVQLQRACVGARDGTCSLSRPLVHRSWRRLTWHLGPTAALFTGKHRTPPHAERVERCLRAGPPRGDKQVRLPTWSPGGK